MPYTSHGLARYSPPSILAPPPHTSQRAPAIPLLGWVPMPRLTENRIGWRPMERGKGGPRRQLSTSALGTSELWRREGSGRRVGRRAVKPQKSKSKRARRRNFRRTSINNNHHTRVKLFCRVVYRRKDFKILRNSSNPPPPPPSTTSHSKGIYPSIHPPIHPTSGRTGTDDPRSVH